MQAYFSDPKKVPNCDLYCIGNRIPAVFQAPNSRKLGIYSYVNNDWSHWFITESLPESWVNVKIRQIRKLGIIEYSIHVDNKEVYAVNNTTPKVFIDVQAEFGRIKDHPDYQIAQGSYRNLQLTSKCN